LLGIASAAFLDSEPRGTYEHYRFVFSRKRGREREREEKKKLGVVVRDTTFGVGAKKTTTSV
jgi:hypothetical protein